MLEYDWGADAKELLVGRRHANDAPGYDMVICADCVYARGSVEPLLESLCQARHLGLLVENIPIRSACEYSIC